MAKTNKEKIRTMSDTRLAKFIAEECMCISEMVCDYCDQEPGKCTGTVSACRKAAANWLNSEKWSKEEKNTDTQELSIDTLNLSTRSYNCLRRAGINSIKDLCNRTPDDMIRIRDLGRKSLDEIIQKMETHGLNFRTELEEHKC